MKLTRASTHVICSLVHAANAMGNVPMTAPSIAAADGPPEKSLEGALLKLVSARILRPRRGPLGGYRLALPAQRITLLDVIEAVDGPLQETLQVVGHGGDDMVRIVGLLQRICDRTIERMRQQLRRVTVQDLAGAGGVEGVSKHTQQTLPVDMNQAAERFDLLVNRTRLKIMQMLAQNGEMTVNELHRAVGQSLPTISRHLKRLRWGLLVESQRRRNCIYYRLASQTARDMLHVACRREKLGANQD